MIKAFLSLGVIFLILQLSELLWRVGAQRGEISRKFVHITVGSFIAIWPFYMSFQTIQLLSVLLFAVVAASKMFRIFKSVHAVKRKTLGELAFPAGIFMAASLTDSPWVFAAAIAHMSLADGLAAVLGTVYLKIRKGAGAYRIFGQVKTTLGTLAFIATSLAINCTVVLFSSAELTPFVVPFVVALSVCATVVENVSGYGMDNFTVPLLITIALNTVVI